MTPPVLHPYQADLVTRIKSRIAQGKRRILIVAPTGSGKTVIIAEIIRDAAERGQRMLVLAHRREIIGHAATKLYAVGIDAGILLPGYPPRPAQRVQVASVATVHHRAMRSAAMEMPPADLVVIDEAHHAPARMYRAIIEEYPDAIILGLTATPCRGDGRGLGGIFEELIEGPTVGELTDAKFLVPAKIYAPWRPDLTGMRVARGEYDEAQLAGRMDKPQLVGDIVEHWHKIADRRPTVVFATGVEHSVHLRDEFRRSGVVAEHIDGRTPIEEREEILCRLTKREVDVVCNAMVLTEGWDQPDAACLVLARPTKRLGLYLQMVGRVLRCAPGKVDALVLDHAGAVFTHGFPDDPITWTLAEDRRAENAVHAGRGTHQAPALTDCPECHAVRFEGRACTVCGWQVRRKPTAFDVADGELAAVNRARQITPVALSEADKRQFHAMLAYIAEERGYKPGWAAHKYRERFKIWPLVRRVEPVAPDAAARAWVRSRQIAFARGRAAAGGR